MSILACWQDARRGHVAVNQGQLRRYAQAFQAHGLDVWVWGYPQAGKEEAFMGTMEAAAKRCGAVGLILDPEVSYKGEEGSTARLLAYADEGPYPYIVTSFGLTSHGMPWKEMANRGVAGSPQIYTVPLPWAKKIIRDWKALGWEHIIPSVPTFGPKSKDHLLRYLKQMAPGVDGFIAWSWRSTSEAEWRILSKVAALFAERS